MHTNVRKIIRKIIIFNTFFRRNKKNCNNNLCAMLCDLWISVQTLEDVIRINSHEANLTCYMFHLLKK